MPLSRSEQMARIKGKNTTPELALRTVLWREGLRYRLHAKTPVGRPDVVFPAKRVAVFVDGCFWHGCPDHYVRPRSRESFWQHKLRENIERDRRQTLELESLGWRVVRIWEHEAFEATSAMVAQVKAALVSTHWIPREDWRVFLVESMNEDTAWERRSLTPLRTSEPIRQTVGRRITAKWNRTATAR